MNEPDPHTESPQVEPPHRRSSAVRSFLGMSWTRGQIVVAVVTFAFLVAAAVVALMGGSDACGTDRRRGLVSVAFVLSLLGGLSGLILVALRRWFLGLIAVAASVGLAYLLLITCSA